MDPKRVLAEKRSCRCLDEGEHGWRVRAVMRPFPGTSAGQHRRAPPAHRLLTKTGAGGGGGFPNDCFPNGKVKIVPPKQ